MPSSGIFVDRSQPAVDRWSPPTGIHAVNLRLFDGLHFQHFQAKGPQAIEDAVEGGLVDLHGSQSGIARPHGDVVLLKGGDNGRDRLTIERDLICPQRRRATVTVIPPSMPTAVALVVTFTGWDRFSPGQYVPPCGPRDGAANRGSTTGRRQWSEGSRAWQIGRVTSLLVIPAPVPRSKFHAPSGPSRLVRRSRLLDTLDRGHPARLTLVIGSPGAGETALLADWLAAHPGRPTAWLSCDPADAVGARFVAAVIEALRRASDRAELGEVARQLLSLDGEISADVIAALADDLDGLARPQVLVIDDLHLARRAGADP